MVDRFLELGLTAEAVHGKTNAEGNTEQIIRRFKDGETQILCATKGKCVFHQFCSDATSRMLIECFQLSDVDFMISIFDSYSTQ